MRQWQLGVALDPDREQPLFLQLANAIAGDIRDGRLKPGDALPGTRELADSLGVNRNTVIAGYDELAAEGLVGTRVGGIPEVIDNGVSGVLVAPGNAQEMAAALEKYIVAPALLRSHGLAARERVQRKYSMAASVACYQDLYDTLCERKIKTRRAIPSCAE